MGCLYGANFSYDSFDLLDCLAQIGSGVEQFIKLPKCYLVT
jgi:hypothetical protein